MFARKITNLIILIFVLTAALPSMPACADEGTEYHSVGGTMSVEQKAALSSYLCRFGACYTTEFESDNGGKLTLDPNNWSDKMSEIIWWQFLAYSKTDRLNPNAPIYGNTKLVTPETLRRCVKNTFDIDSTPGAVLSVADEYYIDHTDGNYHPPQQDPSGTMWTRSPESCKIQYFAEFGDGTYIVHYIPEYLESASGMHNGSLYYAKLKKAGTSCGYAATEIGTVSALDDSIIKMGFLDDAEDGTETKSNIEIDYAKTADYTTIEEYKNYLGEILSGLGENSPNGPAVNEIAAYITAACLRNSKTELKAEGNTVTITANSVRDAAGAAVRTSSELWELADSHGVHPNKDIVRPVQLIITGLDENSPPKIVFDKSLKDDDMGMSNMRVLIGDNSHSLIMDKPTCNLIIENHGAFSVEMGAAMGGGYIIKFFDEQGNAIEKLPTKVNFSIPAGGEYDSVYNTCDGRDFNIGGIYDAINGAIEFKTNSAGLYKTKTNEPRITDIDGLGEEEQSHIKRLVSKDYFTATGTRFRPDDQYTNYDAARAVAGMLFTVDTDARVDYSDIDESDPQAVYVASIDEADIQLYTDQGGLRFNGNSAVGLEDSFVKSLALLVDYKGYYYPDMRNDSDRPYASPYINYPDVQYMDKESLPALALGAREGIINDGMALCSTENRFDRASAAEFLYRLFDRMCQVAPAEFDAGESGYKSNTTFYNPLSTMKFETPPIVYLYLICFGVGILFAIILYIMQKKHKIVNENAADSREDDDYWNEY